MTRRVYKRRTEFIDPNTGEILSAEEYSTYVMRQPGFIKMFPDQLYRLEGLRSGARSVLDIILTMLPYGEQNVALTSKHKKSIAKRLGVSYYTVRNYIYELEETGVIERVGQSTYEVDASMFVKGVANRNDKDEEESGKEDIDS